MRMTLVMNGKSLISYLKRIGIALSVLVNVVLLGQTNQTLSARNWQWKRDRKPNASWLLDKLFGKDHCAQHWVDWTVGKK